MKKIKICRFQSPVGELVLGSVDGRLCLCDWTQSRRHAANMRRIATHINAELEEGENPIIRDAISQLNEYFAGQRSTFTIPIQYCGTEFQQRVWQELMNIPHGETISYAEAAVRIGNPKAVRAVASAIGSNLISIFVPCHRVVGSNNALTGYVAGLGAKQFLLTLEKM